MNIYGLCLNHAFIIPDIYSVQHEVLLSNCKLIEKLMDGSPWKGERVRSFGARTVALVMRVGVILESNVTRELILGTCCLSLIDTC